LQTDRRPNTAEIDEQFGSRCRQARARACRLQPMWNARAAVYVRLYFVIVTRT
jgi:hypothetical protein